MNNITDRQNIISIEPCQRYVTRQISATDWEEKMLKRMRYLRNRGHDTIIIKVDSFHAVVSPVGKDE